MKRQTPNLKVKGASANACLIGLSNVEQPIKASVPEMGVPAAKSTGLHRPIRFPAPVSEFDIMEH